MKKVVVLLVAVALAGCTVGPDYKRPTLEMPKSWRFEDAAAKDTANTAWWGQFDDPVLNELIQIALQENKDVRIAAARVEQFLGQYGTTRAALFPQVCAGASASRQRASQVTGPTPLENFSSASPTFSNYEIYLNASWEIDLWGKLRRATEAARANLLGSEEARRAVILTLVTSVAGSYVNLRDLDKQLEIAKQTAGVREESYKLFKLRFEGGIISELELSQVKSEYEEALSRIPFYEKLIAQQENALSVLLGRNPGPIPRGKSIDELVLPAIPAGLPSDLLANRPDIRQAEENLIAANANIGVAKAQYFPTISLTGLLGFASNDLSKLFTSAGGGLGLRGSDYRPDLHRRRHRRAGQGGRGRSAAVAVSLSAGHPDRLPGGGRRARRSETFPGATRGPGAAGRDPSPICPHRPAAIR